MEMAGNGTPSFPHDSLPTEMVWLILNMTEGSIDVLNIFKVFPSLEGQVMKKKRFEWQIDQLVPLICPWLEKETILNCRLVSRRWARGFDSFLENSQPNGHYNGVATTSNQLHMSREASRAQIEMREQLKILSFQHRFGNSEKFANLERKTEAHHPPSARNPFIGRKMSLFKGNFRDSLWFWYEADNFLEKLGNHIWHLEVEQRTLFNEHAADHQMSYSGACIALIRSLRLLPNLRGLVVYIHNTRELIEGPAGEEFAAWISLPHLESLNLVDDEPMRDEGQSPSPIYSFLVERHASQIRKLEINYRNWRPHYSQILPKLEELTLFREYGRMEEIKSMMASLRAPELRRLELHLAVNIVNIEGLQRWVVAWLEAFPKLVCLKMVVDLYNKGFWKRFWKFKKYSQLRNLLQAWIAEKREMEAKAPPLPVLTPVTSLKSLSVELRHQDLGIFANFDFLRFFPNLEFLDINCLDLDFIDFKGILYFREMGEYDPKLWDVMLPKLKELNQGDHGSYKFFTKAGYDWIPDLEGLFSLSNEGTGKSTECK